VAASAAAPAASQASRRDLVLTAVLSSLAPAAAWAALAAAAPPPAAAHIQTGHLMSKNATSSGPRGARPSPLPPRRARPSPPPPRPPTTPSVADAVARVTTLTAAARAAADAGDWGAAEGAYAAAIAAGPDLALTDLTRVSRALVLRQLGDAPGARLALEDVEAGLRGRAEVHAALASLRYEARLPGAEAQWALATEFDRRFGDPAWVEKEKGWPPAMVGALRAFLELR
jgi:hypothetical protein